MEELLCSFPILIAMSSSFIAIKKSFRALDQKQREALLQELYSSSKDVQTFLDSRLLHEVDTEGLIKAMQKETLGKVYRKGVPQTPDGRKVRGIIAQAKKLGASQRTCMELEHLAFMGFVDYLDEYGGGPDSFEGMACEHLETYLDLVMGTLKDESERATCIEEARKYLRKKRNMITDGLYGTFEEKTGMSV